MKNNICLCLMLACLGGFTSCFEDDSVLETVPVGDIEVTGIEEDYLVTSYVGEFLEISPKLNTEYTADELTYTWTLLSAETGKENEEGVVQEPEVIGEGKDLSYEVDLAPGTYQIRYEVKVKENSYAVLSKTSLRVVTEFSQGFYVMKETVSGDTDLDLLAVSGSFSEDLIAKTQGKSLRGKPLRMSPIYGHFYVNPETEKMESVHMLGVTTDAKEINMFRTTDFMKLFDRETLLYGEMDADEQPIAITRGTMNGMQMIYFSSKGARTSTSDNVYIDMGYAQPCVGKYGFPLDEGVSCSKYTMVNWNAYGGAFSWDDQKSSLIYLDYNLIPRPLLDQSYAGEELTQNLTGYECIGAGINVMSSTVANFMLEHTGTGKRYLYLASDDGFTTMFLTKRIEINPESHMGKAKVFSTNGLTANYVYCIDDNKLWACNLNSDDLGEQQLNLDGISAGETLCYVSNQYWNSSFVSGNNFDYLVVGTQDGDTYHVYMYEMIGGVPSGEPVKMITGTGSVKSVRFLSSSFSENDLMFGYTVYPELD